MPDVTARKRGFYGGMIREPGEVFMFTLGQGETLPDWVEAGAGKARGKGGRKVPEPAAGKAPLGNGVQEALGLPPDWVDPHAQAPKPASA